MVEANILALSARSSGSFNIGSGSETSFNTLIETIKSFLGLDLKTEYFDNPYDFYQEHTCAAIDQARDVLGYAPRYSVPDGIRDYLDFLERPGR